MNKKLFCYFTLLCALFLTLDVQAATWNIPDFYGPTAGSSTGNPYTDQDGNIWACYQAWDCNLANGYERNPGGYQRMQWMTTPYDHTWMGPQSLGYNDPKISVHYQWMVGRMERDGAQRLLVPVLTFAPTGSGHYSWSGVGRVCNWNTGNIEPNIIFGRIDTSNHWHELLKIAVPYDTNIVMDNQSALQNIAVQKGEKLAIALRSQGYWEAGAINWNPNYTGAPTISIKCNDLMVDVNLNSSGTSFHREIMGQQGMARPNHMDGWDPGWLRKLPAYEGTSFRGVAGGDFADSYNWQTLVGAGVVDWTDTNDIVKGQSTLEFMRMARDWNSEFVMTVNVYGIGTFSYPHANFHYTDCNTATLSSMAADLVRYTNHIIQIYHQGDTISDTNDLRILNAIDWNGTECRSDKLLAVNEPRVPKITYWEIGNEVDWLFGDNTFPCYYRDSNGTHPCSPWDTNAAKIYHDKYKAITEAMLAQDPSIKVGPSVLGWGYASYYLDAVLNDANLHVDFIAHHPYYSGVTNYGSTTDSNLVTRCLQDQKRFFNDEKNWLTNVIRTDGRDPNDIETLYTEWNSAETSTYWIPLQYSALGNMESIFRFADTGIRSAQIWMNFCNYANGQEYPQSKSLDALRAHMGDTLITSYDDVNNFRLYATKDSKTGKIAIWGLNFSDAACKVIDVNLRLQNLPSTPTKITLMRLQNIREAIDGTSTKLTDGNPTSVTNKHVPYTQIDWVYQDETGANLSNFSFACNPAEITVLVIEFATRPKTQSWYVPWIAEPNNATPSYTDPNGNTWSVYQACDDENFLIMNNWIYPDKYLAMNIWETTHVDPLSWEPTTGYWRGPIDANPMYEPSFALDRRTDTNCPATLRFGARWGNQNGSGGTNSYLTPVMTFAPNSPGVYSWFGTICPVNGYPATNQINCDVIFGKITDVNSGQGYPYNWVHLFTVTIPYGQACDLSLVPQLQNIYVGQGEKLAMVLDDAGYYNQSFLYLNYDPSSAYYIPGSGSYNPHLSNRVGIMQMKQLELQFPWWTNISSNPYVDSTGNTWSAYQACDFSKYYANPADYALMSWSTDHWVGPQSGGWDDPAYCQESIRARTNRDSGNQLVPVLTFGPSCNGICSWKGKVRAINGNWPNDDAYGPDIIFGKIDSNNKWTQLYETNLPFSSIAFDLSSVTDLQNITVQTGEKLAIALESTGYWCRPTLDWSTTGEALTILFSPISGQANSPSPANAATAVSVTPTLSWTAGSNTTSHEVYFGTNQANVTNAVHSSSEYKGNQVGTTYTPATLTVNTTYYWRIDEVSNGGTTKGIVWSFTTAPVPGQAGSPSPANAASGVIITPSLGWTAGSSATSHDVYFGTSQTNVTNATHASGEFKGNQAGTIYNPGTLAVSTTYYWRIDEVGNGGTTKGTVWSFTTAAAPGQASSPSPANSATGVSIAPTLSWTAGNGTTSHDVYFGTSQTNVTNATHASGEYKGNQAGTTYAPGTLTANTPYYWRIDEVGNGGTTKGTVWSFTTIPNVPTFVAAGTVASGTGAITPALPSGLATNDILLLFLETANQTISIPTPNGGTWTAVTNSPQGTGTGGSSGSTSLTVFWSRYNGTQGAPTTSDSGDHQIGRIIAIRGAVGSGNPWNITAGSVDATSSTSGSIPGATTTTGNSLVVVAIATGLPNTTGTSNFSAWTNSNLTSVTERTDNTVAVGYGGGLGIATGVKVTAGAYGNTTVTLATAAKKGMMSIAIRPY